MLKSINSSYFIFLDFNVEFSWGVCLSILDFGGKFNKRKHDKSFFSLNKAIRFVFASMLNRAQNKFNILLFWGDMVGN